MSHVVTDLKVRRSIELTIDGQQVSAEAGSTLLSVCKSIGKDIPTLCYGDTITPKNACRVCMVEVEGSRTLVPSCSRQIEPAMVVKTDTERTRHSRKLVLELLGSSVDLSLTKNIDPWNQQYSAEPSRFGAMTEHPEVKIDNPLYVRDYAKCILCYQCVDACGEQWQNTFAITTAFRGSEARIATEFEVDLTDSACVYCGNCIQVCPTGALMFVSEYEMRRDGTWNEPEQTQTNTICPYCGVGCELTLHVQENTIVKVTSPSDHSVTHGNLCIKGRFGFQHVQNRSPE